ncbi:hypothetical protein D3C87_280070 [compost metagenome]
MKEAGVLSIAGRKMGTSLAEKTSKIPGTGGATKKIVGLSPLGKKTALGAGLIGAAAAGMAMSAKNNQEKQAAVNLLIDAGIDYGTAVALVEKKAEELKI